MVVIFKACTQLARLYEGQENYEWAAPYISVPVKVRKQMLVNDLATYTNLEKDEVGIHKEPWITLIETVICTKLSSCIHLRRCPFDRKWHCTENEKNASSTVQLCL